MKHKQRWLYIAITAVLALLVFGIGYMAGRGPGAAHAEHQNGMAEKETIWTCSMHPQIQQPKPGKCPICGMDLIPLENGGAEDGPRQLTMSATARKLAQVEVVPARRLAVSRTVRLVGRIDYDETRMATIAAWVPGRLDRLYVDYTGIAVKPGDHMVRMYSPAVLTAQQELLQAIEAEKQMRSSELPALRKSAAATVEAVREKLRLWGLTEDQVKAIEKKGIASDHITINAPIGGIVIHKNAVEGAYVKTGMPIYRIADLRQVWVQLDAYESDLPWLRYGQAVEFTSESYPGEAFKGRISFIDPVLTQSTRTVKVRVNVPNENGKLKPGMFVRAAIHAELAAGGKVRDPDLAGKWISPMHPEVVKDQPGNCDVCGMPLVSADKLGFIGDHVNGPPPLVIPASAALLTGTRAVVYVQAETGSYAGREVVLGPRADDFYVVESGLEEGEKVVVNGNFKIDSALQISAKPSMMNPAGGGSAGGHHHGHGGTGAKPMAAMSMAKHYDVSADFLKQLAPVFDAYFAVQQDLGKDKSAAAGKHADAVIKALAEVDMKLVTGDAHKAWMDLSRVIRDAARELKQASGIEPRRAHFKTLSKAMKRLGKSFGTGKDTVYVNTCPMAFNNTGAEWLQGDPELLNPYFGSMMPACGELVEKLDAAGETPAKKPEGSHGRKEGSHDGH